MKMSVPMPCRRRLKLALPALAFVCLCARPGDAQSLPSPWLSAGIGSPALAGSASASSGVFSIDAAGNDIWGTSDQFHFVYQAISGDVDLRARIDGLTYADAWSKAGVMIRGGLAGGAPHAFALVSPGKGVAFQRRARAGNVTAHTAGPLVAPPQWVRLVRKGTQLTAYSSDTGTTWTAIATDTIELGTTAYAGLAVTSHNVSARTRATVSTVTVMPLSLPAGQMSADIGDVAITGAATYGNASYTIQAAGTDIWDSADQFRFVYQQMDGDGTVVARVSSISYAHAWSKAGVMIRETLSPDSVHAFALLSAGKGYAFQRRVTTGGWSDHTAGGAGAPPGWVRLVRSGTTFTASRSLDGVTWTTIDSASINMGTTVYAGIAVTSHNATSLTRAVVDGFRVTESAPATNKPPVVSITSPANHATFAASSTVAITASASDPEGRMEAVEFYAGATLLARDSTAPYGISWPSVAAGSYSLTAVATDAEGNTATSSAVSIDVGTTTSAPRQVSFTASADHDTDVTSYRLELFASTADPTTAAPAAVSDLGRPTPASDGTIVVDRASWFSALPPGNYLATVSAIGSGGVGRSTAVAFSR